MGITFNKFNYPADDGGKCSYICSSLFSGGCEVGFPLWLKSLMTICCCVNDCYIQNVSISVLLEVINHSQSLALVIEDRIKRYKMPGQNPFFGKLQMVTVPPVAPGVLKLISEKTDFYQVMYLIELKLHATLGFPHICIVGGTKGPWLLFYRWLSSVLPVLVSQLLLFYWKRQQCPCYIYRRERGNKINPLWMIFTCRIGSMQGAGTVL